MIATDACPPRRPTSRVRPTAGPAKQRPRPGQRRPPHFPRRAPLACPNGMPVAFKMCRIPGSARTGRPSAHHRSRSLASQPGHTKRASSAKRFWVFKSGSVIGLGGTSTRRRRAFLARTRRCDSLAQRVPRQPRRSDRTPAAFPCLLAQLENYLRSGGITSSERARFSSTDSAPLFFPQQRGARRRALPGLPRGQAAASALSLPGALAAPSTPFSMISETAFFAAS